jgi:hypothetical protein
MKPHKHAELIKAWADGAVIEFKSSEFSWEVIDNPTWSPDNKYRVKETEIHDFTMIIFASPFVETSKWKEQEANLKLFFDGKTQELKHAEVLK